MAYDRYDPRRGGRDDERGWRGERDHRDASGRRDERGFFERAGEEISSWFGDDDGRERPRGDHREHRDHDHHDHGPDRSPHFAAGREQGSDRGPPPRGPRGRDREDYRPFAGDYSRSESYSSGSAHQDRRPAPPPRSDRGSDHDPHYSDWRQRQMADLDRDYDEYRRENQSRFEREFGTWREQRQQKRQLLGQIREHMEVVGNDDQHVGTVDKVAGERLILTKSDPDSEGAHHSLSCADIDRVEGDKVVLGCPADQAQHRWRDEDRGRALFERQDQGEAGPHILDESFGGTYR